MLEVSYHEKVPEHKFWWSKFVLIYGRSCLDAFFVQFFLDLFNFSQHIPLIL